MIRFTNASLEYARGTVALQDVNLLIARREFVFLTGPSGAGKSTLLKCIYMAARPDSGEVKVGSTSSLTASRTEIFDGAEVAFTGALVTQLQVWCRQGAEEALQAMADSKAGATLDRFVEASRG